MKIYKIIITLLFLVSALVLPAQSLDGVLDRLSSTDYKDKTNAQNELEDKLRVAARESKEDSKPETLKAYEGQLISKLEKSKDIDTRVFVLRMLGLFGSEKSIDPLTSLLLDKEFRIQDEARRSLSDMRGSKITKNLITALDKSNASQKAGFIDALVSLEDKSLSKNIIPYLTSKDSKTSSAAIRALGSLQSKDAVSPLLKLHAKSSGTTKSEIESSLIKIGVDEKTASTLTLNGSNPSIRIGAFKSLAEANADFDVLSTISKDASYPERYQIFSTTMNSNSTKSKGYLVENIKSYTAQEQKAILTSIGNSKNSQYESSIIDLLSTTSDEGVKSKAIETLGLIGTEKSSKPLHALYTANSGDNYVKEALAILNAPKLDEDMKSVLKTPTSSLKEKSVAMELLALRDLNSNLGLIHEIAQSSKSTDDMKLSAFKAMESGNVESAKILMSYVTSTGTLVRPAQTSLKKLSTNLGDTPKLWSDVYEPVLTGSKPEKAKVNATMILDGAPYGYTVDYLKGVMNSSTSVSSTIKSASISNLKRWSTIPAGDVWLELIGNEKTSDKDKSSYFKQIKRLVSIQTKTNEQAKSKAILTVKAVKLADSAADKLIVLSSYDKFHNRDKGPIKGRFKELLKSETDSEVTKKVNEIIAKAKKR